VEDRLRILMNLVTGEETPAQAGGNTQSPAIFKANRFKITTPPKKPQPRNVTL
jgi:hypothetical protein